MKLQKGPKQCHRVIKKTHGMRQSREKHNKSLRFHRDQHCGHTEDLLKSLLGSIIPSARRGGNGSVLRWQEGFGHGPSLMTAAASRHGDATARLRMLPVRPNGSRHGSD